VPGAESRDMIIFGSVLRSGGAASAKLHNNSKWKEISRMKMQQVSDHCFAVLNEKNRVC